MFLKFCPLFHLFPLFHLSSPSCYFTLFFIPFPTTQFVLLFLIFILLPPHCHILPCCLSFHFCTSPASPMSPLCTLSPPTFPHCYLSLLLIFDPSIHYHVSSPPTHFLFHDSSPHNSLCDGGGERGFRERGEVVFLNNTPSMSFLLFSLTLCPLPFS